MKIQKNRGYISTIKLYTVLLYSSYSNNVLIEEVLQPFLLMIQNGEGTKLTPFFYFCVFTTRGGHISAFLFGKIVNFCYLDQTRQNFFGIFYDKDILKVHAYKFTIFYMRRILIRFEVSWGNTVVI